MNSYWENRSSRRESRLAGLKVQVDPVEAEKWLARDEAKNVRGEWVPSIPLPLYGLRKRCEIDYDCWHACDPDCELGAWHCEWAHLPSHKRGWHSQDDCPHKRR